ncbi:hypothetical protein BJX64DRAFT_287174 [Aspergillus heterothallicus]
MAPGPITRVTMIKIPAEEHLAIALDGFRTFAKNQQKDGSPYILSMEAGHAEGPVRDQGYTFVTKSVFRNMEEMRYYETNCPAHNEYRRFLRANAEVLGLLTVHFTAEASFDFRT